MVSFFFDPKISKDQQKKVFAVKLVGFWSKCGWRPNKMKKQGLYHPQIGGVMVSHNNIMMSPQNGVTLGGPS